MMDVWNGKSKVSISPKQFIIKYVQAVLHTSIRLYIYIIVVSTLSPSGLSIWLFC